MKTISSFVLALALAIPASAQLHQMYTSTLAAPVATTDPYVCLASSNNIATQSGSNPGSLLYVDHEPMNVLTVWQGNCYNVARSQFASPHNSGAAVWFGPQQWFGATDPPGGTNAPCTLSAITAYPFIVPSTQRTWYCVNSQWQASTGTDAWIYDGIADTITPAPGTNVVIPGGSTSGGWTYNSGTNAINAASGATVSVGTTVPLPPGSPCNVAAIWAANLKYVTPQMCGAVGDGSTDDYAAILAATSAAVASGGCVYFPGATYAFATPLVLTAAGTCWTRDPGASLKYIGSSTTTAATFGGNSFVLMSLDLALNGNSLATNGVLFKHISGAKHLDADVWNVSGVAVECSSCVLSSEMNIVVSTNVHSFSVMPTVGLQMDGGAALSSDNAVWLRLEGITPSTCLSDASQANHYYGTTESCGIGISATSTSLGNIYDGIFMESNTVADFQDAGSLNTWNQLTATSTVGASMASGASRCKVLGGQIYSLTIASGAAYINLDDLYLTWNNSGALSNSGTATATRHACYPGGCYQDSSPTQWPLLVTSIDLTAQSANITATTAYTIPSTGTGQYLITCYLVVTRAASSSSTLPNCQTGWTDKDTSVSSGSVGNANVTSSGSDNVAGASSAILANATGSTVIEALGGTVIQYATANYASSGGTTMQYALHFKVWFLGP